MYTYVYIHMYVSQDDTWTGVRSATFWSQISTCLSSPADTTSLQSSALITATFASNVQVISHITNIILHITNIIVYLRYMYMCIYIYIYMGQRCRSCT